MAIQYRITGRSAKEISDSVESGIHAGALDPGGPLPSVRALAGALHVAPGTVATAYKLLRDRGLVQTRGRGGTSVRARPPLARRSESAPVPTGVVDLADGQPDPALLPALGPTRQVIQGPAAAPPAFVLPELLALGRRRLVGDGVPADALTLAAGGLDAIGRVLTAQLRPGDTVAVEDPGWPNALDLIAALGMRPYPLTVDPHGVTPEALRDALRAGARAVIVTNRAQNPTGAFLTRARATQLRKALSGYPGTLVIEDDHAAELAAVRLATLADATDSWAFVRSCSKPYGPDLRLALIAGDEATVARVDGRMRVGSGWVSTLLQRLVVELWNSASAAARVARAAAAYDARRNALVDALVERGIAATGATGLNVWAGVADETAVVTGLLQAGWSVAPGFRFRQASPPGIRITVSGLTVPAIPRLADDLAGVLVATRPGRYTT